MGNDMTPRQLANIALDLMEEAVLLHLSTVHSARTATMRERLFASDGNSEWHTHEIILRVLKRSADAGRVEQASREFWRLTDKEREARS